MDISDNSLNSFASNQYLIRFSNVKFWEKNNSSLVFCKRFVNKIPNQKPTIMCYKIIVILIVVIFPFVRSNSTIPIGAGIDVNAINIWPNAQTI